MWKEKQINPGDPILKAYMDSECNRTIGWGHKEIGNENYDEIPEHFAEDLFQNDLGNATDDINRRITNLDLTDGQVDALITYDFQSGDPGFRRSGLANDINNDRFDNVGYDMYRRFDPETSINNIDWGILDRTSAEIDLFNNGNYDFIPYNYRPDVLRYQWR